MVKKGTTYKNFPFASINSQHELLDLTNEELVAEAKVKHYSLIYHKYLRQNNKEQALNVLFEQEKKYNNLPVVKEIIHTYLYFEDYQGALEYIDKAKVKAECASVYEFLIKIHLEISNEKANDGNSELFERIVQIAKDGLEIIFDKRLIVILIEFYFQRIHLGQSGDLEKVDLSAKNLFKLTDVFESIQDIIEIHHYDTLCYDDAEYLYKMMPKKAVFLKKMVELNPKIKKKYYLEYAEIFGIKKDEILRILRTKFCYWALEIGLFYGWIDESVKASMEKYTDRNNIVFNGDGEWIEGGKNEFFRFKNSYST
jgi:hypothetical protein